MTRVAKLQEILARLVGAKTRAEVRYWQEKVRAAMSRLIGDATVALVEAEIRALEHKGKIQLQQLDAANRR